MYGPGNSGFVLFSRRSPLGLAVSLDSVVVPGSTQVRVRCCGCASRGAVWYAFLVRVVLCILRHCRHVTLRVRVFLEYVAMVVLKFARPLVPLGIEGICPSWLHGADGGVCRLLYAVHQMLSLWSLYRYSQRSGRPQPLGSRREAAPCEDTRLDF